MDTTVKTEAFIEVRGGSLVVLSGETSKPHRDPIPIGPDPCVVGRGDHCDVVLDDPRVSTSHCQFTATDQGIHVLDLGSRNGTFIHHTQTRLDKGAYLSVDTRVRVGQTSIEVRVAGPEPVPISTSNSFGPIVGRSPAMRRIFDRLKKFAPTDLSILITGETGTGKELVARAIHEASGRPGAFVTIECNAIPASLAESTLFGHERGSFTGASAQTSPFVLAQGGTVFLDEIGELPEEIQPKLLRVLQEKEIRSIGGKQYKRIDVRIVAATWRDLHVEMNIKKFREDLFHRFAHAILKIPPLRERTEDIPDIVARCLADRGDPQAFARFDKSTLDRLMHYPWPGNVRELRHVIAAAHALSGGGPIDVTEFLGTRGRDPSSELSSAHLYSVRRTEALETFERGFFVQLNRDAGGNISKMERISGLSRPTIRDRLKRYGLRGSETDD